METDILTGVRTLLELGWPAIVLLGWWVIWQKMNQRTEQYINDLREMAGLKASLRPAPPDDTPAPPAPGVRTFRASRASYN